jgi:hypothetical protein
VCCGKHVDEVGPLSWTGLCSDDSKAIVLENANGIHTKSGYPYVRQLRGMLAYIEKEERRLTA